jgi:hypothetical protein
MEQKPIKTNFGYEVIWAKTDSYEARFLAFDKQNSKTDIYLDSTADKTWFINTGKFKIRWIDTSTGQILEQESPEGTVFHIDRMKPTQLVALQDNSSVTEVSNIINHDERYTIMDGNLLK